VWHRWELKTVVRQEERRYIRRCRRCGTLAVAREPGDWQPPPAMFGGRQKR